MSKSISGNSKVISLTPLNGETFIQNQKITIEIDETLAYIHGETVYLSLDIANTSSDLSRWVLPQGAGASALIDSINIYSKRTGILLETLSHYNEWICIENQYANDEITVGQRTEGWGETVQQYTKDNLVHLNPEKVENNMISPILANHEPAYKPRTLLIPLKCGVFSHWDEERAVPVLNFGGLKLEIKLASNNHVCKQLQMFAIEPSETEPIIPTNTKMYSSISCEQLTTNGLTVTTDPTINYVPTLYSLGLAKGMKVVIKGIDDNNQPVQEIRTVEEITTTDGTQGALDIDFTVATTFANLPVTNLSIELLPNPDMSYEISNVALKVEQLMLPAEAMDKLAKPMAYEMTSYDVFLDTIATSETRHQTQFMSVATKAKAIFSMFVNTAEETSPASLNYYGGLRPQELKLTSAQYWINNRLYPEQAYNPSHKADKAITFNELSKALRSINIPVKCLGSNEGSSLDNYSNTFLLARELARDQFFYVLKDAEPELRTQFSGTRTFNTRVYSFVFSKKTIMIGPQGVSVQL